MFNEKRLSDPSVFKGQIPLKQHAKIASMASKKATASGTPMKQSHPNTQIVQSLTKMTEGVDLVPVSSIE